MRRGEIWFAATPGGDRPVLVLTREPVADRIGAVTVAALTRTKRELVSELEHVRKWPPEHWTLAFQGQIRPVSEHDAEVVLERMKAHAAA